MHKVKKMLQWAKSKYKQVWFWCQKYKGSLEGRSTWEAHLRLKCPNNKQMKTFTVVYMLGWRKSLIIMRQNQQHQRHWCPCTVCCHVVSVFRFRCVRTLRRRTSLSFKVWGEEVRETRRFLKKMKIKISLWFMISISQGWLPLKHFAFFSSRRSAECSQRNLTIKQWDSQQSANLQHKASLQPAELQPPGLFMVLYCLWIKRMTQRCDQWIKHLPVIFWKQASVSR